MTRDEILDALNDFQGEAKDVIKVMELVDKYSLERYSEGYDDGNEEGYDQGYDDGVAV